MDEWHYKQAQDLGMSEAQRLRSVNRESGLLGLIGRTFWWFWVRGVLKVTEQVEILGTENLPSSAPFVILANHSSHLDVLVLATALPLRLRNCVFPLAAGDTFFETPAVAAFATSMMNALPLWRKNCGHHSIDALRDRLIREPCGYILFPEGTRSRSGNMGPFRHGIGMLVAGTDVPVVPCHLRGTFEAMPPSAKWPRRTRIVLRIGIPSRFSNIPNERSGWQTIAQLLERSVRDLGEQTSPLFEPPYKEA
jgi:1-acyl-sn-glycerol-3-phosphate acyltransferase